MSEVYTRFQTLTAQKTLPFGAAHAYMAFIGEYPPPPPGKGGTLHYQTCTVDILLVS